VYRGVRNNGYLAKILERRGEERREAVARIVWLTAMTQH